VLAIAACARKEATRDDASNAGSAQAPVVGIAVAALSDVGVIAELPGRLEASRGAEVRARAAGILQQKLFREGSDVKGGAALGLRGSVVASSQSKRRIRADQKSNFPRTVSPIGRAASARFWPDLSCGTVSHSAGQRE
jgi:membrane fusion protein (multidrug efflux system)